MLLPIYMIHQVRPREAGGDAYLDLTPEDLRAQIRQLRLGGWTFVTLTQAWERIQRRARGRYATLTFDDAGSHFMRHARPVLQELAVPATIFVIAGSYTDAQLFNLPADCGEPLPPETLRDLHRGGCEIGSHAMTHRELTRMPPEHARRELKDSRRLLSDLLGEEVTSVAYPRGRLSPAVTQAARAAGYVCGCGTFRGNVHAAADGFALKRVRMKSGRGGWRLAYTATRLYDWLNRRRTARERRAFAEETA